MQQQGTYVSGLRCSRLQSMNVARCSIAAPGLRSQNRMPRGSLPCTARSRDVI